jgi:uncharacterized protein YdaU (DUF1376 family)
MHYYKFNIPDWNLHTAHLSLVEDAIYRRLVDHYYDTESPIPAETQSVFRRLRMAPEAETAGRILAEFFTLSADGWRHKRCDAIISEYHNKANTNKENGKNGGRPRKDALTAIPAETQSVISGNPSETLTINQELLTTNQEPKPKELAAPASKTRGTRLPDDWVLPTELAEWAIRERPGYPILLEAAKFRDFWLAKSGKDATKADWPATWRNWVRNTRMGTQDKPQRHSGFEARNYHEGVKPDGSF